jgi:hypothetical protein
MVYFFFRYQKRQTMNASKSKRNPKRTARPNVRFPGITEDSKSLGVTRPHLWMVLTGSRVSAKLTRRYRELKASQKGAAKP